MMPRHEPSGAAIFTAKMGFITKRIWQEFFSVGKYRATQQQWVNLKYRGLFKPHESPTVQDVLVLDKYKDNVSSPEVSAIVQPPYIGALNHDETLGRIVLRCQRQGLLRRWTSEAELKKMNATEFKLEGSRQTAKYPDALVQLNVPGPPVNVAFELELSRKKLKRYEDVAFAYQFIKPVKAVFFICKSDEIIRAIKSAFRRARFPSHEKPVGFALASEWTVDPARAVLEMPARMTTFGDLVSEIVEKRSPTEEEKNA